MKLQQIEQLGKPYKIYAETLESECISQFISTMQQDHVVQGALMPDAHTGYTVPIGCVVAVKEHIYPSFVGFDIGCLDKDTEYLSPAGWKKISEYSGGQIMQYNTDTDTASFVTPRRYIKKESKGFYHFKHKNGMDQKLSKDHKVLFWKGYRGRGMKPEAFICDDLIAKHKELTKGIQGGIKTTFKVSTSGLSLSDEILRVLVMTSADGHIRESGKVELHFRKERKVERAKNLLNAAGIEFKSTLGEDLSVFIYFKDPRIDTKELNVLWRCNQHQLEIISDECLHWDGHDGKYEFYCSNNKDNVDLIQYAFTVSGKRAGIFETKHKNKNWKPTFSTYKTNNEYVGLPKAETIHFVPSEDGLEYCFTVPSGYFIARRNDKIFITGNCGMCAIQTTFKKDEIIKFSQQIFDMIYEQLPTGFSHRKRAINWHRDNQPDATKFAKDVLMDGGLKQLGTLGSGNHFVEVGYGNDDAVWIIIHSGSRNLGHRIASQYMALASDSPKAKEGFYPLHVKSQYGMDYIKDLNFALEFALENRKQILYTIIDCIQKYCVGLTVASSFINRNHNHTECKMMPHAGPTRDLKPFWIHRKGATHAEVGMMGVIPINMAHGSYIVKGKGNPDSLSSSSHGAGRVMGRKEAKRQLHMETFSKQMEGIVAKVCEGTLDEAPLAYKDPEDVMRMQQDLIEVVDWVKPLISIKAVGK